MSPIHAQFDAAYDSIVDKIQFNSLLMILEQECPRIAQWAAILEPICLENLNLLPNTARPSSTAAEVFSLLHQTGRFWRRRNDPRLILMK